VTAPVVVLAATQRGWAARLRAHAADHGGLRIRATVLTPEDALAERSAVVVVDDITSFLTAGFVAALHDQGRAVLGLHGPGDDAGRGALLDLGVDAVCDAEADAEVLLGHLARLAAQPPEDRGPARPRPASTPGRIVGVVGPPGGVGVTEVALELAAAGAAAAPSRAPSPSAALVDLDELAPCLAQRLGVPVFPNVHTAADHVDRGRPPAGALHLLGDRRPLGVLPGVAADEDWAALRPGSAPEVLAGLAAAAPLVVVDLGHAPARAEGPTGWRLGHALAAAAVCHDLVVVAAPAPTAVARTLALVARLQPVRGRLHLVLNRVGRDRFARGEARHELERVVGVPAHLLRADDAVAEAAWRGARVGRGPFRRDVAALADRLRLTAAARRAA
jgi:MinD-like ATPase involved in chromosome partitioning or flagellar assembly